MDLNLQELPDPHLTMVSRLDDLRLLAKARSPAVLHDYLGMGHGPGPFWSSDCGFRDITLHQRVGIDLPERETRSTMLGTPVAMPVAIAPSGLSGILRLNGDVTTALAARKFGVPYTLSMLSVSPMEEVADALQGHPFWFQIYVLRDRRFVESLVRRARLAGVSALILPLAADGSGRAPVHAARKPTLLSMMTSPGWRTAMGGARLRRCNVGNIVGHASGVKDLEALAKWAPRQFDRKVRWADAAWIRRLWTGKLVLKGVCDVRGALRAIATGADAIIVSGRGDDESGANPISLRALRDIANAVGGRIEVHLAGGIRSGQDVLKAIALGARGTYVSRAHLHGLAAMGESGVSIALEILRKELDLAMGYCGVTAVDQIDASVIA